MRMGLTRKREEGKTYNNEKGPKNSFIRDRLSDRT
jgi:hypothetical protein